MNIFLHELKAYKKSTIIWALTLAAGVILFMLMFPAFTKDVEASRKVLENFPAALRSAFNLSLSNFFTVLGFYSYVLNFIVLAGAIQAMNIGVDIISKEDTGKTADFLLTKPVTRARIITSKLFAALTVLVLTNIVFISVSIVVVTVESNASFSYLALLLLSLSMLLVQFIFLAIGTFFSVILPKIKSVISVTLPTVFALYIIGSLGSILGNDNVRYFTPFKYFETQYIINNVAYETKFLVIGTIVILAAAVASYAIYAKKDIRAAS